MSQYISGCVLSKSATADGVDIASGRAVDAANSKLLEVPEDAFTKVLQGSGAWAAGDGGNGLMTGAIAGTTWYHVFLIGKDDGTVDAGFHLSLDPSANLPTDYTKYRRIGSVRTDGGPDVRAFTATEVGGVVYVDWATFAQITANTTTGRVVFAIETPPGLVTLARLRVRLSYNSGGIAYAWVRPVAFSDVTPVAGDNDVAVRSQGLYNSVALVVETDISQQIARHLSLSTSDITILNRGYIDPRP